MSQGYRTVHRILFLVVFPVLVFTQLYSSQVDVACTAIKRQDVKTLNTILKQASFTPHEKRLLFSCASQAKKEYEKTATFSSETKQSIFATTFLLFAVVGGFCFSESVPYIIMGMGDRVKPVSFSTFFAEQTYTNKRYILSLLSTTVASFSASVASALECDNGYYTDKPRYIYDRISALD